LHSVKILSTVAETKEIIKQIKNEGRTIGFVPTMGFFHEGHLELMRRSIKECGETFVSIFVNPIQFGPNEDLSKYPRDLSRDSAMAEKTGVKYIFHPQAAEMYPEGFQTSVKAGALAEDFCGALRPGHFDGVCTVVAKLFNIITPDLAYFGMKDYQQLAVIEKMTEDLNMSVKIVKCETVREKDGLAMSSRNSYLTAGEREIAPAIKENIEFARNAVIEMAAKPGGTLLEKLIEGRKLDLIRRGFKSVDYFKIADAKTLKEIPDLDGLRRCSTIFIAAAAVLGKTRLIDNSVFDIKKIKGPRRNYQ